MNRQTVPDPLEKRKTKTDPRSFARSAHRDARPAIDRARAKTRRELVFFRHAKPVTKIATETPTREGNKYRRHCV